MLATLTQLPILSTQLPNTAASPQRKDIATEYAPFTINKLPCLVSLP